MLFIISGEKKNFQNYIASDEIHLQQIFLIFIFSYTSKKKKKIDISFKYFFKVNHFCCNWPSALKTIVIIWHAKNYAIAFKGNEDFIPKTQIIVFINLFLSINKWLKIGRYTSYRFGLSGGRNIGWFLLCVNKLKRWILSRKYEKYNLKK